MAKDGLGGFVDSKNGPHLGECAGGSRVKELSRPIVQAAGIKRLCFVDRLTRHGCELQSESDDERFSPGGQGEGVVMYRRRPAS